MLSHVKGLSGVTNNPGYTLNLCSVVCILPWNVTSASLNDPMQVLMKKSLITISPTKQRSSGCRCILSWSLQSFKSSRIYAIAPIGLLAQPRIHKCLLLGYECQISSCVNRTAQASTCFGRNNFVDGRSQNWRSSLIMQECFFNKARVLRERALNT